MTIHELIAQLQVAAKEHGGEMQCIFSMRDRVGEVHYCHDLPEFSYVEDKTAGDWIQIRCGH